MKVVAFNGSPRKDGNTMRLLERACDRLEKHGIDTEIVQLGGQTVRGCTACGACAERLDGQCVITTDCINDCISKMAAADGVLLGSPTYFADMTTEMKALIDRSGYVARANGDLMKGKVGAAVVAVRRAGAIHTFDSINHLFTILQMVIPGSSYWNTGFGSAPGDVSQDAEGLETMDNLAENMAWVMKCIELGRGTVPAPANAITQRTDFIR